MEDARGGAHDRDQREREKAPPKKKKKKTQKKKTPHINCQTTKLCRKDHSRKARLEKNLKGRSELKKKRPPPASIRLDWSIWEEKGLKWSPYL